MFSVSRKSCVFFLFFLTGCMCPGLDKLSLGAFLFLVDFSLPLISWLASARTLWTQPTFFVRLLLGVLFSNNSNLFWCSLEHATGIPSGESLSRSTPMGRTKNLFWPVYIFVFQYKLVFSVKFGIHPKIVISDTLSPSAVLAHVLA